jgi:hypothetical protein
MPSKRVKHTRKKNTDNCTDYRPNLRKEAIYEDDEGSDIYKDDEEYIFADKQEHKQVTAVITDERRERNRINNRNYRLRIKKGVASTKVIAKYKARQKAKAGELFGLVRSKSARRNMAAKNKDL